MSSALVNPTASSRAAPSPASFVLAPRRSRNLGGKVIGLVNNTKFNADHLLDSIAEQLRARYAIKAVVRESKAYFGRPIEEDQAKQLAQRCDVVITAIGD